MYRIDKKEMAEMKKKPTVPNRQKGVKGVDEETKCLKNPIIPHEGAKKIDQNGVEEGTKYLTNPNITHQGAKKIDKNDVEEGTKCLTNIPLEGA